MPFVWIPKKKKDTQAQRLKNPEKISSFYSEKAKLNAVQTYQLTGGNNQLTAQLCGTDPRTIRYWRASKWWAEYEEKLANQEFKETNTKLKQVLDKSLELVMDRLQNGDIHINEKTGVMYRVPMKGHALHRVSMDTIDKRVLLEKLNMAKKTQKTEETQKDKLIKLAEEFAKMAAGKTVLMADVEDAHIINDQEGPSEPLQEAQ